MNEPDCDESSLCSLPTSPRPSLGVVATAFPQATRAGAAMLHKGGNAVDAAVASAWALAVCEPGNSGLGGQSILLIRQANREPIILDGHSQAPAAASLDTIDAKQQRIGPRACTVPSTPAVLAWAQQRFGRLTLQDVLEPAIDLAEVGYRMTSLQHRQLLWCLPELRASATGTRLFLDAGQPYPIGKVFRQQQLASCLRRIAREGVEDFYQGEIARAIADDMKRQGGLITEADLADVAPVEQRPLFAKFRQHDLWTAPPPAGGFLLLLGLKILEHLRRDDLLADPLGRYEMLGETIHAVFAERERLPLRLDEIAPKRLATLIDDLAASVGEAIGNDAYSARIGSDVEEAGETTHLCAADAEGTVVSLTQSIQSLYGSKSACVEYGFLYNNYLVTCPREPHPHQLGSRSQPRSNSAPSLLARGDGSFLTFGAAGSRRSISAVLHTLNGLFDRGLTLPEALATPRIHVKLSRKVWLERSEFAEALCERIRSRFGPIQMRRSLSYAMGNVQAVARSANGIWSGAADPRREGTAEVVEEGKC